jgi:hypothetical protein
VVLAATLVLGPLGLAACDGGPPPGAVPTPGLTVGANDRDALAAAAAAAKDRAYVATYALSVDGRGDRSVTVAVASDGTWIVAVPGGALGGLADVAVYRSADALFQCVLGPAPGAGQTRPDLAPATPGCVRVRRLTRATDPRVQHIFTDWIDALVDRATALSVAAVAAPRGATGSCYSVESNSAALEPPVDPGVYCYRSDGILTAARVGFGALRLTGPVGAAPSTVVRPAPTVDRAALPVRAPAPPPPPPSATATPPPAGG